MLRIARPAWSLHVVAGEDGPLMSQIRAMNIPCETLPFPKAVRAFGENRQPQSGSRSIGAWLSACASKAARLAGWFQAGAGMSLYAWQLRRRLKRLKPDVLHSNGMKMHFLGALAKGNTPLIWHLHDYLSARSAMKPLLRRLSNRCQLLIANSESVAADARQMLPKRLPIQTVYNAVDPDVFTPEGPSLDLDQLAGLTPAAPGTVRIGLVATFAFWKGHEVFLRAAAACRAAHPMRFYIVGGPVYATAGSQYSFEQLRGIANELGLGDRIGFTGFVDDVPAAMRALDIVVHASTEPEPFGLVIVQAMACGRAVIVSAAGGALELVEPEVDALTHPPGDADALAAAIKRLVNNPELRARLGTTGRKNVEQKFARQHMTERIVQLYESLQPSC